jgi:hypothetical protein
MRLFEAATIRAKARAAARALRDLLRDKTLPAEMRKQVENLAAQMGKTWGELEGEARMDPEREAGCSREATSPPTPLSVNGEGGLREAANMGEWLEAMLHLRLTEMADYAFAEGRLRRDERIAVSHAVGMALDAFHLALMEGAVELFSRNPWAMAEEPNPLPLPVQSSTTEAGRGDEAPREALDGEYVALVERSVRGDGTIPVKIIAPGWGSSGYYGADVLERSAGRFGKGTKMYWNHPTLSEERERPERDLRDLAGELVGEARWDGQGPAGPGLYGEAKVFEPFRAAVDELGPHIGVSIRALGKATVGQAEGRTGKVISEISQVGSVDFVTQPGAGGQVLQIFEAARNSLQGGALRDSDAAGLGGAGVLEGAKAPELLVTEKEVESMPEDLKALEEANATLKGEVEQQKLALARLSEALVLREATDFVSGELAKVQLPDATKLRLGRELVKVAPVKDGRIDVVGFGAQIAEAVKAEQVYLAEAAGWGSGQVRGFGGMQQAAEPKAEEVEASLVESFRRMGLDEAAAKQAAKGR